MKNRLFSFALKTAIFPVLAFPMLVSAQNVIHRATTSYLVEPDIQFSIAMPTTVGPVVATPVVAKPVVIASIIEKPIGQIWEVQLKDINIASTFQRWASTAGWRVRWDAQKHFMVEAPDRMSGTFEEVVKSVLESSGIAMSSYPLEVCFYPNTPPLARITRKGEQDKECS